MDKLNQLKNQVIDILNPMSDYLALLPIRLLMAYEFWTAGMTKFNGTNWFERFQDNFIFPFNYVPVEISWFMATWAELIGALCLFFGLFTRFWALSLVIVSIVAISGVHWPDDWSSLSELWKGYAITDKGFGNYRVPLLFIAMLFPLIFSGAGKISLDNILAKKLS